MFSMVPDQWTDQPVSVIQFSCRTIVPERLRVYLDASLPFFESKSPELHRRVNSVLAKADARGAQQGHFHNRFRLPTGESCHITFALRSAIAAGANDIEDLHYGHAHPTSLFSVVSFSPSTHPNSASGYLESQAACDLLQCVVHQTADCATLQRASLYHGCSGRKIPKSRVGILRSLKQSGRIRGNRLRRGCKVDAHICCLPKSLGREGSGRCHKNVKLFREAVVPFHIGTTLAQHFWASLSRFFWEARCRASSDWFEILLQLFYLRYLSRHQGFRRPHTGCVVD